MGEAIGVDAIEQEADALENWRARCSGVQAKIRERLEESKPPGQEIITVQVSSTFVTRVAGADAEKEITRLMGENSELRRTLGQTDKIAISLSYSAFAYKSQAQKWEKAAYAWKAAAEKARGALTSEGKQAFEEAGISELQASTRKTPIDDFAGSPNGRPETREYGAQPESDDFNLLPPHSIGGTRPESRVGHCGEGRESHESCSSRISSAPAK